MNTRQIPIGLKVVIYQFLFLLLHYLYEWFPNGFTRIFSGTNESVFQHMKIGFFTFVLLVLIEYLWTRRSIQSMRTFLFTRMLIASLLPFFLMHFFFVGPLLFVKIENLILEILFANLGLIASSVSAFVIERQVEKAALSKGFIAVSSALFSFSLLQYLIFTQRLPWIDVFSIPPGY